MLKVRQVVRQVAVVSIGTLAVLLVIVNTRDYSSRQQQDASGIANVFVLPRGKSSVNRPMATPAASVNNINVKLPAVAQTQWGESKVHSRRNVNNNKKCTKFRNAARVQHKTRLYFEGDVKSDSRRSFAADDVTLATQLTLDRFSALELMLSVWQGEASVALHVTEAQAANLRKLIDSSHSLNNSRHRVAYHVVYKSQQQALNPINYLRNVAINNTRTPFVFYVDVDLIPVVGLYTAVRNRLNELLTADTRQQHEHKVAFVVPSFEAFSRLSNLPANKTELLSLMSQSKVGGYRMNQKWNFGHKPTNFSRWTDATQPYDVTYRDAFEPYVVVRSDAEQRFNERLVERMADKALYIRALHAAGYKLRVLPDVFVVHLPHSPSPAIAQLDSSAAYQRCADVITEEYKRELETRYPTVEFLPTDTQL